MNAQSDMPKKTLAGHAAAARVLLGRSIMQGKSLDGRDFTALAADAFLEDLFAVEPCPAMGEFAFWSEPDGNLWLYVGREVSGEATNYLVAAGDMGGAADQVTLGALGVESEEMVTAPGGGRRKKKVAKLTFVEAAFFLDVPGPAEAMKLEKRVGEGEFMSRISPERWKDAPRFNAALDGMAAAREAMNRWEDPVEEEGVDGGDAEGGDAGGDDGGIGGIDGDMVDPSDDAPPVSFDDDIAES